jgi:BASS family bile acid:Na+ symporter
MEISAFQKMLAELFILMYLFSVGLMTSKGEVISTLKDAYLTTSSLLLNFIIIPLIGLFLISLFVLPLEIKTGLILLIISPGGLFSLNFVRVSKGNINLAIALTCLLSILAIILTPLLAWFLIGKTHELLFSLRTMSRLLILILLPLYIGRLIASQIPKSRALAETLGISSIIIFIVFNLLTLNNKSQALDALGSKGVLILVLLVLIGWSLGFLMGGKNVADKKVFAISASMRNVAFCYPFALNEFAHTDVIVPILAFSSIAIIMNMGLTLILKYRETDGGID